MGRDGAFRGHVPVGESVRVVVPSVKPRCVQVTGLMFELERSFLLPPGRDTLGVLVELHLRNPAAEVLVVGHTDSSGAHAYNDALSLDRARAVAAFLCDDAAAWLAFYDHTDPEQRWGEREDRLMLASVRDDGGAPYLSAPMSVEDAVRELQRDSGLEPTGEVDDATRTALVSAYMAAKGTTLAADTVVSVHGCGEHCPARDVGDFKKLAENRRVEIFLFPLGVKPKPVSDLSGQEASEYEQWVAATTRLEVIALPPAATGLRLLLCDAENVPMAGTVYTTALLGEPPIFGRTDSAGVASIDVPAVRPETIVVAWGADSEAGPFPLVQELFTDCTPPDAHSRAVRRLQNLGFAATADLEEAVVRFQERLEVDASPLPVGLVDGSLPTGTLERVDAMFDALLQEVAG